MIKKIFLIIFSFTISIILSESVLALQTKVVIDSNDDGFCFEGVGALSAGAPSRLLKDYPEPYRSDILDYLFKPGFGASLQHFKFEVGGDMNSTCGTEPSHARTREEMLSPKKEYFDRSYEIWMAQEAKKRNPDIILDVLQWGAPGWFDGGFYSRDNADYIVSYIKGAKQYYNLDISYCGLWNEKHIPVLSRKYVVEYLRPSLDNAGMKDVKIVGNDMYCNSPYNHKPWSYADELLKDEELRKNIDVLGYHYLQVDATPAAKSLGMPIWESEAYIFTGTWEYALDFVRNTNKNYIKSRAVKAIVWNPIDSYYPNVSWNNVGLMEAKMPWCGYYNVRAAIWALAHYTQFVQPGWRYLNNACGEIGDKGSYVTLYDSESDDYSIIIAGGNEKSILNFSFANIRKSHLQVWKSDAEEQFVKDGTIEVKNNTVDFIVQPNTIYSLTTTTGQTKGVPAHAIPAKKTFPLNHKDDFESYEPGKTPVYLSDQGGAFEIKQDEGGNKMLQQVIITPLICWDPWGNNNPQPFTEFGDLNYSDYDISVDVKIPDGGCASVFGRVSWFESNTGPHGVGFFLTGKGEWRLECNQKVTENGTVKLPDGNVWNNIKLSFKGYKVHIYCNGTIVGIYDIPQEQKTGLAGIGSNWTNVCFDNLSFETPVPEVRYGEYKKFADIDFENGTGDDIMGNAVTILANGATVTNDTDRKSKVMQFNAAQKGYLQFRNSPLNDEMTLSFWFKQEDYSTESAWQMMFAFYAPDGSNIYYTPLTPWNSNSYFILDNKEYNYYSSLDAGRALNDKWVHYAVVFNGNKVKVYQDGRLVSDAAMPTLLSDFNTTKWYFGNQPELNYPMTGRMDDIQIFHSALTENQINAIKDGKEVPAPADLTLPYAWFPFNQDLNDIAGNASIKESYGVSIIEDGDKEKALSLQNNGWIGFSDGILGSGKVSVACLFKTSSLSPSDNNRYLVKFNAENGNSVGVRIKLNDTDAALQMVSVADGIETNQVDSGNKCILNEDWNSLVFIQTYTAQGTPAVKVYLNGVSVMVKVRFDIHELKCNGLALGDKRNGLKCLVRETKIFHDELTATQIKNILNSDLNTISFVADAGKSCQKICNFGASDGWNAQPVGLYFSEDKKEKLAELLFSSEDDENGNPKGIGLTAWRFNIGAGTYEQGSSSRISPSEHRTECFLTADGTYDWSKQAGQRWFLEQAVKKYKVPDIIGWQNSPPVCFTVRGLGFREYGDPKKTILKADKFEDFGKFLSDVILHFKSQGIDIKYISPLNEPQWDWSATSAGEVVAQEGTPWTNQEIRDVVKSINDQFVANGVDSKIFVTEAGSLNPLLGGTGEAYDQLNRLWNPAGSYYMGKQKNLSNIISAHSYWDDDNAKNIVERRTELRERIAAMGDYQYWQTEYSLLGNNYKFGHPSGKTLTSMESGISLARIIHNDLALGNATGWQWWTTFDFEANMTSEDRFSLIRVAFNKDKTQGIYRTTKLLYVLGNYSRFVRPGMRRIETGRSDNSDDIEAVTSQMVSSYYDEVNHIVVMVVVNAAMYDSRIKLSVINLPDKWDVEEFTPYITSDKDGDNLKKYPVVKSGEHYVIPGTSVVTFVGQAEENGSVKDTTGNINKLTLYPNPVKSGEPFFCTTDEGTQMIIMDLTGKIVSYTPLQNNNQVSISTGNLKTGMYLVSVTDNDRIISTQKLIVK